jgi:hypothetical protein
LSWSGCSESSPYLPAPVAIDSQNASVSGRLPEMAAVMLLPAKNPRI